MRRIKPQRIKDKGNRVTLLGVISNGSTADARRLLKRYDYPDATDYDDLEYKLTRLYKEVEDKNALEKQLANIHPHKEFILKYMTPTTTPDMVVEKVSAEKITPECSCGNPYCPSNYGGMCSMLEKQMSNASGCGQSNASGCGCSGADGSGGSGTSKSFMEDKGMVLGAGMLGLFTIGIISIFALTLKKQ